MTRLTLILAVMLVSIAAVPPLPRMKVESPKGKEQRLALVKVAAPALVIVPRNQTNTLTWSGSYTQSVAFSIEWKTNLTQPWKLLANVTNLYTYVHRPSSAVGFYRVGAFYP